MPLELPELPLIPESARTPQVEALLRVIELQRLTLEGQAERLVALERENAELKERIARLEKNSSNSSKPPSSDITKPKEEQRQPGKRKIGAQPGHKANWRREFCPEEIDRRRKLHIVHCPKCSTKLQPAGEVIVHQQAELVEKPVIVTEYQLHGGHCPCCKKTVYPALPQGVVPDQLLGPGIISLLGYMKAAMGVSISELAEFSSEVLKLDISRGAVQNAIFRVSEALKPVYEELAQAVPQQKADVPFKGFFPCTNVSPLTFQH
jgi:transposase